MCVCTRVAAGILVIFNLGTMLTRCEAAGDAFLRGRTSSSIHFARSITALTVLDKNWHKLNTCSGH
jgi:hypothetical protein